MGWSMDSIEIYISDSGSIVIKQDSGMKGSTATVELHPDQVEIVIRWLREAKAELEEGIDEHDKDEAQG